jgi:hypothetical protein
MCNLELKSSSTIIYRPDLYRDDFFDETFRSDKNFEIVYTALETFHEAKVTNLNVCYRVSNPDRIGVKNPQGIPETLTLIKRIKFE